MTNVGDSFEEQKLNGSENTGNDFTKKLLRLAFLGLLGILFLSLSSLWISAGFGVDVQKLMSGNIESGNAAQLSALRTLLILNSVLAFILPAYIYNMVSDSKFLFKQGGIETGSNNHALNLLWATGFFLMSLPLVMLSAWANQLIPLPDWANQTEDNVAELLKTLLADGSTPALFLNILMLAFLPALGEEWFFRGSLQRIFTQKIGDKNPWQAILITAFLFSLLHFQFEGFLPRFLLGIVLGYVFYKTGNIWIAVFLHFLFNASQILMAFLTRNDPEQFNADKMDSPPWYALVVCTFMLYILFKKSPVSTFNRDEQV